MKRHLKLVLALLVVVAVGALAATEASRRISRLDRQINDLAVRTINAGREIFRFDTFGDETFWGDTIKLHQAIAGSEFGGVGPGLSPRAALTLGLKVDADALPGSVVSDIKHRRIDLDDPAVTLALLRLDAVVGVTGFFDAQNRLRSVGIQCALCHSVVDDSVAPGIGGRLDGWANRDLDVGAIVNLAPDLSAFAQVLGASARPPCDRCSRAGVPESSTPN